MIPLSWSIACGESCMKYPVIEQAQMKQKGRRMINTIKETSNGCQLTDPYPSVWLTLTSIFASINIKCSL